MTISWRSISALLLLGLTLPLAALTSPPTPPATYAYPGIDLHAHLFFHEGMGTSLLGSFSGRLRATTWSDRLFGRVNAETLQKSDIGLAIIALYSHPLFLQSQKNSLRAQIREAEDFVRAHPEWIIARSAIQARNALSQGKRVLVFSIEGASSLLDSEDDLKEFIDGAGVSIVTPLHFTDDEFGGAGFMPGIKILVNPWKAFLSLFSPHHDESGVRVNPHGLTDRGVRLIDALVQRGVWIDLSHASDAAQKEILPILEKYGQPPLYTHTILRSAFQGERGISPRELKIIRDRDGLIGILPSDDMLEGTQVDPRFCPAACNGHCQGGIAAFLTQFSEAQKATSRSQVLIGSDVDAPLNFLSPGCEAAEKSDPKGLWNYSQLTDVWKAVENAGLLTPQEAAHVLDLFLNRWERVKPSSQPSD